MPNFDLNNLDEAEFNIALENAYAIPSTAYFDENTTNIATLERAKYDYLGKNARVVCEGDSIIAGSAGCPAIFGIGAAIEGLGFLPNGYNVATGGETAVQMATQIATVNALKPDLVIFGGGTNDIKVDSDVETIWSAILTCIDGYVAAGAKFVLVLKVLERFGVNAFTAPQEAVRVEINSRIAALALSRYEIVCEDDISWFTTGHTADGTHPTHEGSYARGTYLAPILQSLFTPRPIYLAPLSSDNYLQSTSRNPALTGTTGSKNTNGTITGDIPTDWFLAQDAALTVICSVIADYWGKGLNGFRMQVTGTASGTSNNMVKLRCNSNPLNGAANGSAWEGWWRYALAAGHAGINSFGTEFGTTVMQGIDRRDAVNDLGIAMNGILRPGSVAPFSAAPTTAEAEFNFKVYVKTGEAVNFDVVIGAPYLRQIEAERLI